MVCRSVPADKQEQKRVLFIQGGKRYNGRFREMHATAEGVQFWGLHTGANQYVIDSGGVKSQEAKIK